MAIERFHCDECMDAGEVDDCHAWWCDVGRAEERSDADALFIENESLREALAEREGLLREYLAQEQLPHVDVRCRALLGKGASDGIR